MEEPTRARIRIGIGGWTYEPWRGVFYPAGLPHKRELEYASRKLTSIEINGTFYGAQKPENFARWHDETPEDFVFALKAPRFTTHRKVLADAGESIERFFASGVMQLKDKLGPVNWQLAPGRQYDPDDFERFLRLLPERVDGYPLRHAIEVRDDSFRTPGFVALAREYNVAIVLAGDAQYPQIADLTAPFVYARIMGTVETKPRGYDDDALDLWAERMRAWKSGSAPPALQTIGPQAGDVVERDVYLYVISGYKANNPAAAITLIERLEGGSLAR